MSSRWDPYQIKGLIAVSTGALGLLLLICGTFYLLATGIIKPDQIGPLKNAAGITALAVIAVWVIRIGMRSPQR